MSEVEKQSRSTERRLVLLAFSYAFSTSGAYVIGRSVADSLFLARLGAEWLPMMFLISACTVGLLSIGFLRLATNRTLKQVILAVLAILSLASLILCSLLQEFDHALGLLVSIYLLAEIRGCLNTMQYGILINELFASSPNHRYIAGWLGAAATSAGIIFGTVVAFEVHQLGTVQLLYVVAGLELLAMLPIALLSRRTRHPSDHRTSRSRIAQDALRLDYEAVGAPRGLIGAARSPYVRGIAALVSLAVIVGTLIDFQWKSSVANSFLLMEDQMTSFFGLFHALINLITGAIQILLTGKILHYLGTRTALLVFPIALLSTTVGVLLASFDRVLLTAITLSKGCDVFKRSVNDPAIWILYAPLSDRSRRRAVTLISGIVKPSAEAVAALLILSFSGIVSTRGMSYIALTLLCVWTCVALRRQRDVGE